MSAPQSQANFWQPTDCSTAGMVYSDVKCHGYAYKSITVKELMAYWSISTSFGVEVCSIHSVRALEVNFPV